MTSHTTLAVEVRDIALLSGEWTIVAEGFEIGSTSAEVRVVSRTEPGST